MWIITCHQLRRDRRGVSNIIVVALSLVIVLAIVTNIVLCNYEMNQVDWEKMKEAVSIKNIEPVTHSPWFTVQNEYTVNIGSKIGGTYFDTHVIDGAFESFIENGDLVSFNLTIIDHESFEGSWPPFGWSESGSWNRESDEEYHGSYSADFDGGSSGYLDTPILDCSDAEAIFVDFWYRDDGSETNEFVLQYYDGESWDTVFDLGATWDEDEWHHYQEEVTDDQYFKSNFRIRWETDTNYDNDDVYVDFVTITKNSESGSYSYEMDGAFSFDLSTYPLEYIQTIEIELRYRASDSGENWFLRVYDWVTSEYSDSSFNSTNGNTPTTEWDSYVVNLTDSWQNYINEQGLLQVEFDDQDPDGEQTYIDIDFLGVRVQIDGIMCSFKNESGLTLHLVSLWIINSTNHQQYDINLLVNAAETKNYSRVDIPFPIGNYIIKVVTERGNIAVFSGTKN